MALITKTCFKLHAGQVQLWHMFSRPFGLACWLCPVVRTGIPEANEDLRLKIKFIFILTYSHQNKYVLSGTFQAPCQNIGYICGLRYAMRLVTLWPVSTTSNSCFCLGYHWTNLPLSLHIAMAFKEHLCITGDWKLH